MDEVVETPQLPTVGLRDLRHDARTWVDRATAGERVLVTDRGRVVAELVPHRPTMSVVDRLIAEGRLIPSKRKFRPYVRIPGPVTSSLSDALQAMRDEEYE